MQTTRLTHVTKKYGRSRVVDDLSFEVAEGFVTGLLGPNGAGKTTAIRLMLGLARPSSGSVELLGTAPGSAAFTAAMRQVGALIEGPANYGNASARANLRIELAARGVRRSAREIDALLDLVGLTGHGHRKAGKFSLGMKQRLALAIALVTNPRLLILDEPTNGLDPAGIVEIRNLIRALPAQGTTVLVSSHLLGEVQLMCDRVTIVDAGRTVGEGDVGDLLSRHAGSGFLVRLDPADIDEAQAALASSHLPAEPAGPDVLLVTAAGTAQGAEIAKLLAARGIYPQELVRRQSTLEDIFLDLTGAHAQEAS